MNVKRLIVCCDGTWNTVEDDTNVRRIFKAIADQQSGALDQVKYYDQGVGIDRRSMLTGGLFGLGLDINILQGYVWLCRNFAPSAYDSAVGADFVAGPEIFIFGFSRGAFTARSLAGLISRCGLIKRDLFGRDELASEAEMQASAPVREAWRLYRKRSDAGRNDPEIASFRQKSSHNVRVRLIAVWDTVGALGIPTLRTAALPVRSEIYAFHDLKLSPIVDAAYHAVAIDEHREDFNVALWNDCTREQRDRVEQRWFPGAHSNVGGGYLDDRLPDISLAWIATKAAAYGLRFNMRQWPDRPDNSKALTAGPANDAKAKLPPYLELDGDEYQDSVHDSYAAFHYGNYNLARRLMLRGRFYRPMLSRGVNETVDPSAGAKLRANENYRPRNLPLAGRTLTPEEIGT